MLGMADVLGHRDHAHRVGLDELTLEPLEGERFSSRDARDRAPISSDRAFPHHTVVVLRGDVFNDIHTGAARAALIIFN